MSPAIEVLACLAAILLPTVAIVGSAVWGVGKMKGQLSSLETAQTQTTQVVQRALDKIDLLAERDIAHAERMAKSEQRIKVLEHQINS